MKEKNNKSMLIITLGLILWILYLCDSEMSRYGIYTIFSYNVHELLSAVPFLCCIISIGWLIFLIVNSIRKKDNKSNIFLCILLLILCVTQINYIHNRSQTIYTSCVASIESIDREKLEIIINLGENSMTLDSPMLVQDLLKTDGTEYGITYEWKKSNSNYGKLCMIQSIN